MVRRLLLRIVYRSVYDWMLYRCSKQAPKRRLAAAGYRWLFLEKDTSWIFSFGGICDFFGKSEEEVRVWLVMQDLRTISALYRGKPTTFWGEE